MNPAKACLFLLVSALFFPAVLFSAPAPGRIVWESSYAEALAKAKKMQRPLFLFYEPVHGISEAFDDPMVVAALESFVCVNPPDLQNSQFEKLASFKGGSSDYCLIDSATEDLLAMGCVASDSLMILMRNVTKGRAASGLSLTPQMQRALAMEFNPNARRLAEMTEAGDLASLLAYLKPLEKDEFRAKNFFVFKVRLPPTIPRADVVLTIWGPRLGTSAVQPSEISVVRPSGIYVLALPREQTPVAIEVTAPGCIRISDTVADPASGLVSREYALAPLPKAMAASLQGRVFFQGGAQVAGAIVRICDTGIVARTDKAGRFYATGIPPGTFLVRAETPGGEFQESITFSKGQALNKDLPLTKIPTLGIRWALQTKEGSPSLTGEGVRTGEAYFSLNHSPFVLERGAEKWWGGGDFTIGFATEPRPHDEVVFWVTGRHVESAKFDDIKAVNGGQPFDDKTYFDLKNSFVHAGDVFTLRCLRRDCYAKIEIIDVTPR